MNDHCDTKTVGRVASQAEVGTLVLYHPIPGSPAITDEAWRALIAPHSPRRIVVARDLMVV